MKLVIDYRLAACSTRGMARYCREMTKEIIKLLSSQDDVLLYVDKGLKKNFLPDSIKYRVIPTANFILGEQFFIPYYLGVDEADILWSPSNTFPLWKINGIKYHATIHDLIFLNPTEGRMSLKQAIGRLYRKYIVKLGIHKLDGCYTVSEYSKNQIETQFNVKDVIVTPNCIGGFMDRVKYLKSKSEYYREDFFFTLSGDAPSKNFDLIFNYFNSHPHQKLVVGGFISDSAYRTKSPSNISFLKPGIPDDELIGYYLRCKCFLFVSKQEGFGIPILEALACGCKVIASDSTSIPEIAGENALYINPHSMDELEQAIEKSNNIVVDKEKNDKTLEKYKYWNNSAQKLMERFV